jgi:hypothetical protein
MYIPFTFSGNTQLTNKVPYYVWYYERFVPYNSGIDVWYISRTGGLTGVVLENLDTPGGKIMSGTVQSHFPPWLAGVTRSWVTQPVALNIAGTEVSPVGKGWSTFQITNTKVFGNTRRNFTVNYQQNIFPFPYITSSTISLGLNQTGNPGGGTIIQNPYNELIYTPKVNWLISADFQYGLIPGTSN